MEFYCLFQLTVIESIYVDIPKTRTLTNAQAYIVTQLLTQLIRGIIVCDKTTISKFKIRHGVILLNTITAKTLKFKFDI